jgi:DNA modification methylase
VLHNEETVILDPFAGSGTTGVVAAELGCSFIGFEIDPEHATSANKRIASTNRVRTLFQHPN